MAENITSAIKRQQKTNVREACEYQLFLSLEKIIVMPKIQKGFKNVDEFVEYANSVMNRRKSRAGRSLELHAKTIFEEEGLPFSHGEVSEQRKKPDFLFPSAAAYHKAGFPANRLRMLAAKTTCKDRWRQILNEADKIPTKHLLTLQEGVSLNQYTEMKKEGVVLVVPAGLHKAYPKEIRPELLTFESFIKETKESCY